MYRKYKILILLWALPLCIGCTNSVDTGSPASTGPSQALGSSSRIEALKSSDMEEEIDDYDNRDDTSNATPFPNPALDNAPASLPPITQESSVAQADPVKPNAPVQVTIVDKHGNPVYGMTARIAISPTDRDIELRTKDRLYDYEIYLGYTGTDGQLFCNQRDYETILSQQNQVVLSVSPFFGEYSTQRYSMHFSPNQREYRVQWDGPIPLDRTVDKGIILTVVDENGQPLEGIFFSVDSVFPDYKSEPFVNIPGSFAQTYPSDIMGKIYLAPVSRQISTYQYKNTIFEIEYLDLEALVEKTIVIYSQD